MNYDYENNEEIFNVEVCINFIYSISTLLVKITKKAQKPKCIFPY